MGHLGPLKDLYEYLASFFRGRFVSRNLVLGVILGVIAIGGILVYILATAPAVTTTSPYP